MRRISTLLFRALQVTYVYVRSYRGAHNALNCSHLRRFTNDVYTSQYFFGLWQLSVTYVYVRSFKFSAPFVSCLYLRRFNGLDRATFVILPHRRQGLINLCTLLSRCSQCLELLASPPFYYSLTSGIKLNPHF